MNEDQASALFAPARERPIPTAAFTMTDVFAADSRLRRRRRTTAVVGTVATVVLAVVGFFALSGTGTRHAVTPASVAPSGSLATDVQAALDQLPLPAGSVRLKTPAVVGQTMPGVHNSPDKVSAVGYWSSPLSRDATLVWLRDHLAPTWNGGSLGFSGDTENVEYDRTSSESRVGPNFTVSVAPMAKGSSVAVTAWAIPVAAKSAEEVLADVTGATLSTKDEVAPMDLPPLRAVTLTTAQAQRLASEVNMLSVDDGSPHSCTVGTPDVVMDFVTKAGHRKFLYSRGCHSLEVFGDEKGRVLNTLGSLYDNVEALLKAATGPVRGTLIVTLAPNIPSDVEQAGTIKVFRKGAMVDSGEVASGHIYIVTEPPGVYDLTATSAGRTCKPGTARLSPSSRSTSP